MPDLPVPEAAVRAVQQIPGSPRGIAGLYEEEIRDILAAAAPHIGAAHIRRAAQTIRETYPVDVFPDPTSPGDPPERHAGAMARAVARQLDVMARETEADRG